jgi:hypothetical protein
MLSNWGNDRTSSFSFIIMSSDSLSYRGQLVGTDTLLDSDVHTSRDNHHHRHGVNETIWTDSLATAMKVQTYDGSIDG